VSPAELFERYRDLRAYLAWSDDDLTHAVALAALMQPHLELLIDDFYNEIQRHPEASRVLRGGEPQIRLLKQSLRGWLEELFSGQYDANYVRRRWLVGLRHAEIGLNQVYTHIALARLRLHMLGIVGRAKLPSPARWSLCETLNKLLDLDLALIVDSYEFHRLQMETRAERERSERKFRNLVEAAACMIVIMREDFRVVYFSPYAEHLTGHAAVDVLNKPFGELFAVAAEVDEGMHEGWLSADAQLPITNVDMPIRCRDGSVRWLAWNALRLDEFEGATAVLAVGHDITEKRRSAERLLQAERLAAIGQTITGLAHESRNALQRINSCTEMLEFEVEGNSEALQLIRRSQQAQDDLARLFDEVRNFAAPISLELTSGPVDKIWREAWGLMHSECRGRDASLREKIEVDDLVVVADRFRLVQVFRNLFENSLAACGDPVRIEIVCRSLPPGAIDPSELPRGPVGSAALDQRGERRGLEPPGTASDWIEIRVRDNGPGLDPRARREVFEPFFTTKTKGTGLGMAIAHRVLAAHGGSITVGDPSRRGAEFVLRWPRACDEPVPSNRRRG
jgi:hypothetical protein